MALLYLLAAITYGPFKFLVGLIFLVPFALIVLLAAARIGYLKSAIDSRFLPYALLAIVLSMAYALVLDIAQPIRTTQEILMAHRDDVDKAAVHSEIDRNLSIRGLALRGLIHYGPLALCLFGTVGLSVGSGIRGRKQQNAF